MEYLPGGDLYQRLADKGTLPLGEAVAWVAQAVLAIEDLHALNIVHRDVKPGSSSSFPVFVGRHPFVVCGFVVCGAFLYYLGRSLVFARSGAYGTHPVTFTSILHLAVLVFYHFFLVMKKSCSHNSRSDESVSTINNAFLYDRALCE